MSAGFLALILMALAAYRSWRLIGQDTFRPLEWFRGTLERLLPAWLADGIGCPWCLGSWCSFAVVAVVDHWFRPLPMPVLWALAVAALVGIVGDLGAD